MNKNHLRRFVWKIILRGIKERKDKRLQQRRGMADSEQRQHQQQHLVNLLPLLHLELQYRQLVVYLVLLPRHRPEDCLEHPHQPPPLANPHQHQHLARLLHLEVYLAVLLRPLRPEACLVLHLLLQLLVSLHRPQHLEPPLQQQEVYLVVQPPLPLELHNKHLPSVWLPRQQPVVYSVRLHRLLQLVVSLVLPLQQWVVVFLALLLHQQGVYLERLPQHLLEDYLVHQHQLNQADSLELLLHQPLVGFLDLQPPRWGVCMDIHPQLQLQEVYTVLPLPPPQFLWRLLLQQKPYLPNNLLQWKTRRSSWNFLRLGEAILHLVLK